MSSRPRRRSTRISSRRLTGWLPSAPLAGAQRTASRRSDYLMTRRSHTTCFSAFRGGSLLSWTCMWRSWQCFSWRWGCCCPIPARKGLWRWRSSISWGWEALWQTWSVRGRRWRRLWALSRASGTLRSRHRRRLSHRSQRRLTRSGHPAVRLSSATRPRHTTVVSILCSR